MSALRWTILILGILAMAGIWLHWRLTAGRRRARPPEMAPGQAPEARREPELAADDLDALAPGPAPAGERAMDEAVGRRAEQPASPAREAAESGGDRPGSGAEAEEAVLVLHVAARPGEHFNGEHIVRALNRRGLVYEPSGVFYRRVDDGRGDSGHLFGAANMLEPGTFDIAEMENLQTVGLVLFSMLPGPLPGRETFDEMLGAARGIAEELDGVLLDGGREPLTDDGIERIRSKAERHGPAPG